VSTLIDRMQDLLRDPELARHIGEQGRLRAIERFNIGRFVSDWNAALAEVTSINAPRACAA
jgi:glycosyltransferase involved in cell wall biosynthesis